MKSLLLTSGLALAASLPAFGDIIIIDSFTAGTTFTSTNTNGTASFNYLTGASESELIGGRRQIRTRAASSGHSGSSNITINTTAGTLSSFGGDQGDRSAQYGTGIGSDTFTGAGPGSPIQLNLNLDLADKIEFDVTAKGIDTSVHIALFGGGLKWDLPGILINNAGTYSYALAEFPGLTESQADDIDGFRFFFGSGNTSFPLVANALVVDELRIVTAAIPEPASFAALAGLGVLGLAATRRRRAA